MRHLFNERMRRAKGVDRKRVGSQNRTFSAELRTLPSGQMVVDLPMALGAMGGSMFPMRSGQRVWFNGIEGGVAITANPRGPRGPRRHSGRIQRVHTPFRLLKRLQSDMRRKGR